MYTNVIFDSFLQVQIYNSQINNEQIVGGFSKLDGGWGT